MAFKTSRTFTSRGRPPRLAGGIAGSTSAHSASVRSLGYRKPRRFAARRCSGVHIEHPLESIRVLNNESHPIPSTQQLLGSTLTVRIDLIEFPTRFEQGKFPADQGTVSMEQGILEFL